MGACRVTGCGCSGVVELSPPKSAYPWRDDYLSQYLLQTEGNTYASSINLAPMFQRLQGIHALWMEAGELFTNTPDSDLLKMWFYFMSNSAWLGAVRLLMGGQPIDAQPLLRSALEYAAYALHIARNADLGSVWLERQNSEAARSAVRAAFNGRELRETIAKESAALSSAYEELYEGSIDFGAHPNEQALSARLRIGKGPAFTTSSVDLLTDNPILYRVAAKRAAQVGIACLSIFGRIFRAKFEIMSVDTKLDALKNGL